MLKLHQNCRKRAIRNVSILSSVKWETAGAALPCWGGRFSLEQPEEVAGPGLWLWLSASAWGSYLVLVQAGCRMLPSCLWKLWPFTGSLIWLSGRVSCSSSWLIHIPSTHSSIETCLHFSGCCNLQNPQVCVAVVSPSSWSSAVLAVLLTNPVSVSRHCLPLFPLEQQNLWLFHGTALSHGHILMIFTSLCSPYTHLISSLFSGYFCFVAFKPSFSFWIKTPHFGLYFLYIQGGLFLLSFRQYLSNFIILSGLLSLWISLFYKCQGSDTNSPWHTVREVTKKCCP